MFLTSPYIDQAIALKFRILSIKFRSDRLSLEGHRGPNYPSGSVRIPGPLGHRPGLIFPDHRGCSLESLYLLTRQTEGGYMCM